MKRLFLFLFLLLLIGSVVFTAPLQHAQAKAKVKASNTVNLDSVAGMPVSKALKTYGKHTRIDASEYGFNWYILNRDYKKFMMLGVDNGQVVAVYCNSNYLSFQGKVRIGTSRSSIRKQYGEPLLYTASGNSVYIFPNTDKKDIFLINGYYVYFYYDLYNRYTLTSIMMIKKEYEDNILAKPLQLSNQTIAAYNRQSVDLVNSIRARKGLKKLSLYSKASQLSNIRSADMRDNNYFSHYTPDGKSPVYFAGRLGLKYSVLCENIACGHKNAISCFEAFMNSSGHRKNILNKKVQQIGVGVVSGGERSVYATYSFLKKK